MPACARSTLFRLALLRKSITWVVQIGNGYDINVSTSTPPTSNPPCSLCAGCFGTDPVAGIGTNLHRCLPIHRGVGGRIRHLCLRSWDAAGHIGQHCGHRRLRSNRKPNRRGRLFDRHCVQEHSAERFRCADGGWRERHPVRLQPQLIQRCAPACEPTRIHLRRCQLPISHAHPARSFCRQLGHPAVHGKRSIAEFGLNPWGHQCRYFRKRVFGDDFSQVRWCRRNFIHCQQHQPDYRCGPCWSSRVGRCHLDLAKWVQREHRSGRLSVRGTRPSPNHVRMGNDLNVPDAGWRCGSLSKASPTNRMKRSKPDEVWPSAPVRGRRAFVILSLEQAEGRGAERDNRHDDQRNAGVTMEQLGSLVPRIPLLLGASVHLWVGSAHENKTPDALARS